MPTFKSVTRKAYDKATKQDVGVSAGTQINLLRQFINSPVYKQVLEPLHRQIREEIISRGKSARVHEDKLQMWAALEACDLILDTPGVRLKQLEQTRSNEENYQHPGYEE